MKSERWLSVYGIALAAVIAFYRSYFGLRVVGYEHIPKDGPLLIAANHVAYLDPPAVGAALAPRHLSYLAKQELFSFKPFGALIGALNAFPVDRSKGDTAALKRAVALLKQGRALLVFPEGARNRDGSAEAKNGVALIAKLSGVPVVPAYIAGSYPAKFRRPITVVFGEPLHFDAGDRRGGEALTQWRSELMTKIYALRSQSQAG